MEQQTISNQRSPTLKPDAEGMFFSLNNNLKVEFTEFSSQWTKNEPIESRQENFRRVEQESQHFVYNPNLQRGSDLPRSNMPTTISSMSISPQKLNKRILSPNSTVKPMAQRPFRLNPIQATQKAYPVGAVPSASYNAAPPPNRSKSLSTTTSMTSPMKKAHNRIN